MAWTLDGVRIFVQDLPHDTKQTIARLQPLSGGTVLQIFGYENPVYKLSGIIVGSGDLKSLEDMSIDGATHTLSGYFANEDYYVASFSAKPKKPGYQSMRPDLDCEAQVYDIDMDLFL
jgi:hypothetical protein